MGELMRHSVLVENRPGAGSFTGTECAARATPDGHTLLVSSGSSMVINAFLYKHLPYDALRGFVLVGFIAAYPFVLIERTEAASDSVMTVPSQHHQAFLRSESERWGADRTVRRGGEMRLSAFRGV